jgi:argininosuccinate synthase
MRVALAYSGDSRSSAAIQWLRQVERVDVIAVTLDLGQGVELTAARDRALALGARRAHVIDARERFVESFIMPALRADALHEDAIPMADALARPLIAQTVVEIAAIERADAVAHTALAAGPASYPSRMDALFDSLGCRLPVLAPHRTWTLTPETLASFSRTHGLDPDAAGGASVNIWGETTVVRADAGRPTPAAHRPQPPSAVAHVDIEFERGVPSGVNGVTMPVLEIVTSLTTIAAMYGVGSVRAGTMESHAPAAMLLHLAHRELVRALSDSDVRQFSPQATRAYVALVEGSAWFSVLRQALDDYFSATHAGLAGRVRLQLHRGAASLVAVEGSSAAKAAGRPSSLRQG